MLEGNDSEKDFNKAADRRSQEFFKMNAELRLDAEKIERKFEQKKLLETQNHKEVYDEKIRLEIEHLTSRKPTQAYENKSWWTRPNPIREKERIFQLAKSNVDTRHDRAMRDLDTKCDNEIDQLRHAARQKDPTIEREEKALKELSTQKKNDRAVTYYRGMDSDRSTEGRERDR